MHFDDLVIWSQFILRIFIEIFPHNYLVAIRQAASLN